MSQLAAFTAKELLDEVIVRANQQRKSSLGPSGREFALAVTAAEDTQMRFTRGLALNGGTFAPADLER